jgi:hypothetical protein
MLEIFTDSLIQLETDSWRPFDSEHKYAFDSIIIISYLITLLAG